MRVLPFTIPKHTKDALILQRDVQPAFYGSLHQHPEYQISLVREGAGNLIAGDGMSSFQAGDVVVLAGNLPHVFNSHEMVEQNADMQTIFFTKDSFGTDFFETEELRSTKKLFKHAEMGYMVRDTDGQIANLFDSIWTANKLDRFILFIKLLGVLSKGTHQLLAPTAPVKAYSENEGKRMRKVIEYTLQHYPDRITLESIATEAAMTKNAFCKYFKGRTRKSYFTFLNEIRVEQAVRLLQEERELTIAEIAERCGFRNISNFNRTFRNIKGGKPSEYRTV